MSTTPLSGSTPPSSSAPPIDIIYFPFFTPEEMGTGDSTDDLIEG
jgi:hypothetical protein